MNHENSKPKIIAAAAVAAVAAALIGVATWKSPPSAARGVPPADAPAEAATSTPAAAPHAAAGRGPLPARQWKPGDSFVYEIRSERVVALSMPTAPPPRAVP